ncbi:glycosyltransferase family 2 protein [Flavisphingomonas formosensis]|uniref:glycosyltransferase family 2 protein n=1 Tax=Flavisphingomonas formosensis TaxID=861534 RepID=UPI0012FCA145|nr:glycosyltransferase family A protein [Sphingomonas formosensis]
MRPAAPSPSPQAVSVVIPCHNYARYLRDAIDSVLAQSHPVSEILVVDDGSTDETVAVATGYGEPVRLLSQARAGISGARNAGIAAARFPLLAFLDADDLWPAASLADRLAALGDADGVFGAIEQFPCPHLAPSDRVRLAVPEGAMAARFAGSMLVRKRVFDGVGMFDPGLRVGEMIEWLARCNGHDVRFAQVASVSVRRRIHGNNSVLSQPSVNRDYLKALRAAVKQTKGMARS